jgi:type II secretory pathway component GspD/PulD (secretin)
MNRQPPYQQFTKLRNLRWILSVCPIVLLLLPIHVLAGHEAINWSERPVTVNFPNEPLSKVLNKIAKQAGLSVLYDQTLANEIVNGNYNGVKASKAITRLFKGQNLIVQVIDDKKIIIVKTFGTKDFIWSGEQNTSLPITRAELDALHTMQSREYQENIADQNSVLEGGLTLGEMNLLHEEQYDQHKASILNADEVIDEKGMTRGQLNSMHEEQHDNYQINLIDNNEVLIEGITRRQLDALHNHQYQELIRDVDEHIDIPDFGITLSQLDKMHEQQYAENKEDLKDRSLAVE